MAASVPPQLLSGKCMPFWLLFLLSFADLVLPQDIYHNHFAVHIPKGPSVADVVASNHGFVNLGQIGALENHYLFEHPRVNKRSTVVSHPHHERLSADPDVIWFEQQRELKRTKRQIPAEVVLPDPLFQYQWFLNHGASDGSDMNVIPAWQRGYTGKGVVVTILDDGIQTNHPDLAQNYDPQASTDINDADDDPMPRDNGDNKHGTRCAGEVAAVAFNEYCGVGVAYNASIGGVRMLDGTVNDAVEAKALSLNPNHIDVYSASWGPEDDGKTVDGPGPLAKKAFQNGVYSGRQGLGSIFVWASGNGGRKTDNCNCDGYTNSIYTLSISSATQGGRKPWYLEECSSTLATTYSSGTPSHDASITTVDQDQRLRSNFICTSAHTGTSASAPIAAGICALALEANPRLSWRDMQHMVVLSANPKPLLQENGWNVNGVGRHFSHKFGYGLMDASAMVELALTWPGVGPQLICKSKVMQPSVSTPRKSSDVVKVAVESDGCEGTSDHLQALEHVQCKVTLQHSPRGSLHMVLISPLGTRSSLLLPRPRDMTDGGFDEWPFLSVHFWGEPPNGTWTLEISHTDSAGKTRHSGTLKSWQLILYGTVASSQQVISPANSKDEPDEFAMDIPDDVYDENFQEQLTYQSPVPVDVAPVPVAVSGDGCHPECINGCESGSNPNKCTACRNFNHSGQCVPACPHGTFPSVDNNCLQCSFPCSSCYGPLNTHCLSCGHDKNKLYVSASTVCVKECPRGWRSSGDGTRCVRCPANCANCNEDDECENCDTGLVLRTDSTKLCVAVCPSGQFADRDTRTCQPCHQDCSTCTGPLATQCARCASGRYYYQRSCKSEGGCSGGHFAVPDIAECAPCPEGCTTCSGPSPGQCKSCREDWILKRGICMPPIKAQCKSNEFYDKKQCQPCHPTCSTCSSQSQEGCLTCKKPHPLMHITSCVDKCPDTTFQYKTQCLHCSHACNNCTSLKSCLSCHSGYYLLPDTGQCVPGCADGQYADKDSGTCQKCPTSCLHCSSSKRCLTCALGKLLTSNGRCVDRCPAGFYSDHNSHRCMACHGSCYSCSGPAADQCMACSAGNRLHNHACFSCGLGRYYNAATSKCAACHATCMTCSGPRTSDCTSCPDGSSHEKVDEWNSSCVTCCTNKEVNDGKCCQCDEKRHKCVKPKTTNKRSSSREHVSSRYRTTFFIACVVAAVTVTGLIVFRRWRRYKCHLLPNQQGRKYRNGKGSNNGYHQLPLSGLSAAGNGGPVCIDPDDDASGLDDEDEEEEDSLVVGDERRRLVQKSTGNVMA